MIDDNIVRNRRNTHRDKVNIKARYFVIGSSLDYRDCDIIDISRTGLALSTKITPTQIITRNKMIYIDICIPSSLNIITICGEIKRVSVLPDIIQFVIHSNNIIDKFTYNTLIMMG